MVNAKGRRWLGPRGAARLGRVIRALVAALLVLSPAAWATTVLRADVPALTRRADSVVRGKVLSLASHWTGDHLRIVTDVRLQVLETLKGEEAQTVTIRQPGGIVGDVGQKVSGLAAFKPGEEVVVFLERRGPVRIVAGLAQGKFHLDRLKDGQVRATPGDTADAEVIDPVTRAALSPARTPVPLARLKAEIQRAQAPASPR